jgi:hypothetical protein
MQNHGNIKVLKNKIKGKTIPVHAWSGPEGSSRLRLPDINTTIT